MSAPWTPERDAELIRLRHEGFSFSEIGRTLGLSRNAVIGRACRLRWAGVEFPATPTKPREVVAKPKREPRVRVRAPRPVATPAENSGKGVWDRSPAAERRAWRVVEGDVWRPLDDTQPVPLVGRAPCQCAWPVGGQGADLMACADPVQTGSSYCATHHRLAWIPLKTPVRVWSRKVERLAARC